MTGRAIRIIDENLHKLILPDGIADTFYNDDELPGFKVRVRRDADGRVRRTWRLQYRGRDGKQGRAALGSVDKPAALSATKARQKATELLVSVRAGDDPQRARKAVQKARKELLLDCALLEDRRTGIVGKRPMSRSSYLAGKRTFEQHFASLARRPVALITDDEVRKAVRQALSNTARSPRSEASLPCPRSFPGQCARGSPEQIRPSSPRRLRRIRRAIVCSTTTRSARCGAPARMTISAAS